MKKVFIIMLLAVAVGVAGWALDPFSGKTLHSCWLEYKSAQARTGKPVNDLMIGLYMGFVAGVLRGTNLVAPSSDPFAIPERVTMDQLCAIVGNYLDAHPEEWDGESPGEYLVGQAILPIYGNKSLGK
jgi:Rap1a immunity proteins